jgi:hypothetical protein
MKKMSAPSLRQGTRGARAPKAYSPLQHGCTLPPTMKLDPRGFGVTAQELGRKTSPWLRAGPSQPWLSSKFGTAAALLSSYRTDEPSNGTR